MLLVLRQGSTALQVREGETVLLGAQGNPGPCLAANSIAGVHGTGNMLAAVKRRSPCSDVLFIIW